MEKIKRQSFLFPAKLLITSQPVMCLALLAALSMGSCAKDRNQDDYKRDLLRQEAGKLEPAAGRFTGFLISKKDKSKIGALQIDNSVSSQSLASQDQSAPSEQAVLNSIIQFTGSNRFATSTLKSSYVGGIFKAEIPVTDPTSTSSSGSAGASGGSGGGSTGSSAPSTNQRTITIQAALGSDGVLRGSVGDRAYPDYGATFELTRTVETLPTLLAKAGPIRDTSFEHRAFFGSTQFLLSGQSKAVSLIIDKPAADSSQALLTVFTPVKSVVVTLNYGDDALVKCDNAIWDFTTGTINAPSCNVINSQTVSVGGTGGSGGTGSGGASSPSSTTSTANPGQVVISMSCDASAADQSLSCRHRTQSSGDGDFAQISVKPGTAVPHSDDANSRAPLAQSYLGVGSFPVFDPRNPKAGTTIRKLDVLMTVTYAARSRFQEILDLYFPYHERMVTATFSFINFGFTDSYSNATWDENSHRLSATATSTTSGQTGTATVGTFNCDQFLFSDANKPYEFSCSLLSALIGKPSSFHFEKK